MQSLFFEKMKIYPQHCIDINWISLVIIKILKTFVRSSLLLYMQPTTSQGTHRWYFLATSVSVLLQVRWQLITTLILQQLLVKLLVEMLLNTTSVWHKLKPVFSLGLSFYQQKVSVQFRNTVLAFKLHGSVVLCKFKISIQRLPPCKNSETSHFWINDNIIANFARELPGYLCCRWWCFHGKWGREAWGRDMVGCPQCCTSTLGRSNKEVVGHSAKFSICWESLQPSEEWV